jgi:hypothetical protein
MNFERGKDPIKAMGIGDFSKRDFPSRSELIKWIIRNAKYINPIFNNIENIIGSSGAGIIHPDIWEFISEKEKFTIKGVNIYELGTTYTFLPEAIKKK